MQTKLAIPIQRITIDNTIKIRAKSCIGEKMKLEINQLTKSYSKGKMILSISLDTFSTQNAK